MQIEALAELALIAILIVAFAFAIGARVVTQGVVGVIGRIVGFFTGGTAASALEHQLENLLVTPLVNAEASIDAKLGRSFHMLATLVEWPAKLIERHAKLFAIIAELLTGHFPLGWGREVLGWIEKAVAKAGHVAGNVLHQTITHVKQVYPTVYRNVVPRLSRVETQALHALPRELDRLGRLEGQVAHEVDVVIPRDLAKFREQVRAAEDQAVSLYKWLRHHATAAASFAFAGAIAVALARLDVSWIRCRNWGKIGKRVCGLPSALLDDLLMAGVDVLLVSDICEIVNLTTETAKQFEPLLLAVVDTADALIGCHGATKPAPLAVQGVPFAPVTQAVSL